MKLSAIAAAVLGIAMAAGLSGCVDVTAPVPPGGGEPVAGFSQDDIDSVARQAVEDLCRWSGRYDAGPGARRVVNVKNVVNDTLSRGATAEALSEQLGQSLREQLTNSGKFVVYNEDAARIAVARGQPVVTPEFVLYGKLQQRNMRRDGGNVYQEFALNLQLVDLATSLETWQKRITLRKGVDRRNAMAN